MTSTEAQRIIEVLLFASESPLSAEQIRDVLGTGALAEIQQWVAELRAAYAADERSLRIEAVAGGYQMTTDASMGPWIRKLFKEERAERLSGAALETLAIVAYRQPITRADIEQIRGVNVDGVMRTLLEKGVIKILGRKEVPGRPVIYGTTREFLQHFGLNSLADLPPLPTPESTGATATETTTAGEVTHEHSDATNTH